MKLILSRFDLYWTDLVQDLPTSFAPLMKAATVFGQPVSMGIILGILGLAALLNDQRNLVLLYSATLVLIPMASVIKIWVHRPRPSTYTRTRFPSHSFPSGHAYSSTLTLGIIAFANQSVAMTGFAILFALLVGISRIYRGAHFPSDVLGGWVIASPVIGMLLALCVKA